MPGHKTFFAFIFCVMYSCLAVAANLPLIFFPLGIRQGEIAPCGCPRVQLGGLNRLVAFTEAAERKGERKLFFDLGDSFFALPSLPDSRLGEAMAKAELIADAYRHLGVVAIVPGVRDFAVGTGELIRLAKRSGASLVAANLTLSGFSSALASEVVVERFGTRFGVTGVTQSEFAVKGVEVSAPLEALKKAFIRLQNQKVDLSVALLSDSSLYADVSKIGFDLILTRPTQAEGKTIAWQNWDLSKKKLLDGKEEELTPDWEKPTKFSPVFDKYLATVREKALDKTAALTVRQPGAFVAQAGTCQRCHEKQYAFWESTKHASAYLVLFSKNQHLNPECIGCHSLGFYDPKGYKDITAPITLHGQAERKSGEVPFVENFMKEVFSADTGTGPLDSREQPERYAGLKRRYHEKIHSLQKEGKIASLHMGVQCEHCHGVRDGHPGPKFRKVGKVTADRCTHCHTPPHDDSFNFSKRVKQIACPRGR